MLQFFRDMSANEFLLTGLLAGILASVACGLMGPYVIARRIVFLSGAIAHMAVGGIGAAIFLVDRFPETLGWMSALHGAIVAALFAAIIIGIVHDRVSERMDTLIGAMWAVGMAGGILLIKYTDGYQTELMSYLFGNITVVAKSDLVLMAGLIVAIVATLLVCHKRLLAICLDPQQAELQGINVMMTHILLLSLVALTVICMIQVVGLILVLALLTLPAATAAHHLQRLAPIMFASMLLCTFLTTLPRIAVYGTRISPESAIVLSAGAVYLVSVLICTVRRRAVG